MLFSSLYFNKTRKQFSLFALHTKTKGIKQGHEINDKKEMFSSVDK